MRQTFTRVVGVRFEPIAVASVTEARAALERLTEPPAGAIIDHNLPDGSGLDFLEELRRTFPGTPALIVTGLRDPAIPNRSHLLDAMFAAKPVPNENVEHFLQWIEQARAPDPLAAAIASFARTYKLPPREVQILQVALGGVGRRELASTLGISENTLKSRIRALLGRTGETSLDGVERRVLALATGKPERPPGAE